MKENKLTYSRLFYLFIVGSLLGVIIEGIFCLIVYKRWETHVVSIIGPFCILYGIGASLCYVGHYYLNKKNIIIQFLTYSFVGFIIELICGLLLEFVLGMRAWDYSKQILNIRGHVSLQMSLGWGIIGILFSLIVPYINQLFSMIEKRNLKIFTISLSIIMIIDLSLTTIIMTRYSSRHYNIEPQNKVELLIDKYFHDDYMKNRFMEWRFLDEKCDKYN